VSVPNCYPAIVITTISEKKVQKPSLGLYLFTFVHFRY